MALELVEVALFAVLFGVDAYGYAKLKESEKEIERIERKQELGIADNVRTTRDTALENNAILKRKMSGESVTFNSMTTAPVMTAAPAAGTEGGVQTTLSPDVRSELDAISEDVRELRGDHESLKDRVAGFEDDHAAYGERIASVERDVAELNAISSRIDSLESRVESAESSTSSTAASEFESRITEVEKTIMAKVSSEASPAVLEKLKESAKRLNDLKERVKTVEEDFASHMGETPVAEASMMQRMDDADAKLAKLVESRAKAAEEAAAKRANEIERKLGRQVTEVSQSAESAAKNAKKAVTEATTAAKAADSASKTATAAQQASKKATVAVRTTATRSSTSTRTATRATARAKAKPKAAKPKAKKATAARKAKPKAAAKKPATKRERSSKAEDLSTTKVIVETVGAKETTVKSD